MQTKIKDIKYQNIIAIGLIIFSFLIIFILMIKNNNLWGSTTDWDNQHYVLLDYFRKLFYDTFNFFPDFAFNLGGGQNIYNFLYYGLFSPILLLSFLFPFIKMIDFVQICGCLIPISSAILMYFYLKKKFSYLTALSCSLIFLFASPLIFQSHRHLMFINYMPFIVIALFGVDRFINKSKMDLLILSLFFIIISSYYFSIGALFGLFIYCIYSYIKNNNSFSLKVLIKLTFPYIIAIIMSMFVLLPTAYTLFSGRGSGTDAIDFIDLFMPNKTLSYFLYSGYTLGLSVISFVAVIYNTISKKKENIFLGSVILCFVTFPIFNYILNGTLYIYAKALIPLLPIIIVFVGDFFEELYNNEVNYKKLFFVMLIVLLYNTTMKVYKDLFLLTIVFLLFIKWKKKIIIFSYLLIILMYFSYGTNKTENYVNKNYFIDKKYDLYNTNIDEITKIDNSLYRLSQFNDTHTTINLINNIDVLKTSQYSSLSNYLYSNFAFSISNNYFPNINALNVVETINPLFNSFMGVKYIISEDLVPFNSEIVKEDNGVKVYKNNNFLPIGYASSNIITNGQFEQLNYPSTMVNLLNNIIVENYNDVNEIININPIDLDYDIIESNNIVYDKNNNRIIADKNAKLKLKLKNKLENQILFIRITTSNYPTCSNNNLAISINGINNRKTCETYRYHLDNNTFDYAIYDTDELNITFTKNNYDIENVEFYLLDYSLVDNLNEKVDEFIFDKGKTKGDYIVGNIDVTKDGYFALSIPYDKGFKIKVDGQSVDYEKVNTSFIGFPISEGEHYIEIEYEAPFKKIGMSLSVIGFVCYFILVYKQKKKII